MQQITSGDFENWKQDLVTQAFMYAVTERIEDAKEVLATQAGLDLNEDNFLRGFIRAYRECLLFRVDDLQENIE